MGTVPLPAPGVRPGDLGRQRAAGSLWHQNPSRVLSGEKAALPVPAVCARPRSALLSASSGDNPAASHRSHFVLGGSGTDGGSARTV